jgi:hypothetical protein
MPEVLVEFDTILRGFDGSRWVPRTCTGVADDGLWEGWIEFVPLDPGTEPVRTARETEQTTRDGVLYWAQGLTQVYLEGALRRAVSKPLTPHLRADRSATPAFDRPQAHRRRGAASVRPRPVLNPFEVYLQGHQILVSQLSALGTGRLRDIVIAYDFASLDQALDASDAALVSMIVAGVRRPLAESSRESRDERSV